MVPRRSDRRGEALDVEIDDRRVVVLERAGDDAAVLDGRDRGAGADGQHFGVALDAALREGDVDETAAQAPRVCSHLIGRSSRTREKPPSLRAAHRSSLRQSAGLIFSPNDRSRSPVGLPSTWTWSATVTCSIGLYSRGRSGVVLLAQNDENSASSRQAVSQNGVSL